MVTTVTAIEARRNLGKLLNIVLLRQEELIIERAGKPVARLAPIARTQPAAREGKLDFRRCRGLGRDLWRSTDAKTYLEGERQAWD